MQEDPASATHPNVARRAAPDPEQPIQSQGRALLIALPALAIEAKHDALIAYCPDRIAAASRDRPQGPRLKPLALDRGLPKGPIIVKERASRASCPDVCWTTTPDSIQIKRADAAALRAD
jgi:hypothetical protein